MKNRFIMEIQKEENHGEIQDNLQHFNLNEI